MRTADHIIIEHDHKSNPPKLISANFENEININSSPYNIYFTKLNNLELNNSPLPSAPVLQNNESDEKAEHSNSKNIVHLIDDEKPIDNNLNEQFNLFPKRKSTPYSSQGDGVKFSVSSEKNQKKSQSVPKDDTPHKSKKPEPNNFSSFESSTNDGNTFHIFSSVSAKTNSTSKFENSKSNSANKNDSSSLNSSLSTDFDNIFDIFNNQNFSNDKFHTRNTVTSSVNHEIEITIPIETKSKNNNDCCDIL